MGISWFVVSRYILELSRAVEIIFGSMPYQCTKLLKISDFAFFAALQPGRASPMA